MGADEDQKDPVPSCSRVPYFQIVKASAFECLSLTSTVCSIIAGIVCTGWLALFPAATTQFSSPSSPPSAGLPLKMLLVTLLVFNMTQPIPPIIKMETNNQDLFNELYHDYWEITPNLFFLH